MMSTNTIRRPKATLEHTAGQFLRHPSPWMLGTVLVAALMARLMVGDWHITDLMVPLIMVAVLPFFEWVMHVVVLHWRPRAVGPLQIDPLLARKHREHHVDPRRPDLIYIPWQAWLWALPLVVGVALLAFPRLGLGLSFLLVAAMLALGYEWTHYLIHSDYKPQSRLYRAVWRNHRNHHFKNESYWFTVTTAGTADRVLGTAPDPAEVPNSPTAKNLHALKV